MSPSEHDPAHPSRVPAWRRYLRFWGARAVEDVDDELQFHLDMRARDYAARGLHDDQARAAAEHRLGDLGAVRGACVSIAHRRERQMRRSEAIDTARQDVAFALRTMRRQPAWTTVVIATLALGIGACTAVFSVVNALILNPLPYRDARRIVTPWLSDRTGGTLISPSIAVVDAWRARSRSIDLEMYQPRDVTLRQSDEPEILRAAAISPTFLGFTGATIVVGRNFHPDDLRPDAPPVAMLSERAWHARYGGARSAIGQRLTLDDTTYVLVGVVQDALRLPNLAEPLPDVWLPLRRNPAMIAVQVVGRLRPGVTITAARSELEAIAAQVKGDELGPKSVYSAARLVPPGVSFRESLFAVAGAVLLLLLVACVNVAHLLIARGATREPELAIRSALGASRGRLIRQLLTESALLSAAGGVAGIVVGAVGLRALVALRPSGLGPLSLATMDHNALAAAVLLAAVTGLFFGSVSARRSAARRVTDGVIGAGARVRGTIRRPLRSVLIVTEMAVSTILLVCATLLVRTVANLQRVDAGFEVAGLYTMSFDRPRALCGTVARCHEVWDALRQTARTIPGVIAATSSASPIPQDQGFVFGGWQAQGQPLLPAHRADVTAENRVLPEYFATLGMRLREGRAFDETSEDRHEVIISEVLAKRLWPTESAIGKQMREGDAASLPDTARTWLTVVGVTPKTPILGFAADWGNLIVYYPSRHPGSALTVRVLPGVDPRPALRRLANDVGGGLALPRITRVQDALSASIATQRFTMTLLMIFACLAVVLSSVGLYGVIAYLVAERTQEIGIRIALGGTARHIVTVIAGRAIGSTIVGMAIGLVGARWAALVVRSILYGVTTADPRTYAIDLLVLLAVSAAACLLPLRRALRVDPLVTIRA